MPDSYPMTRTDTTFPRSRIDLIHTGLPTVAQNTMEIVRDAIAERNKLNVESWVKQPHATGSVILLRLRKRYEVAK